MSISEYAIDLCQRFLIHRVDGIDHTVAVGDTTDSTCAVCKHARTHDRAFKKELLYSLRLTTAHGPNDSISLGRMALTHTKTSPRDPAPNPLRRVHASKHHLPA